MACSVDGARDFLAKEAQMANDEDFERVVEQYHLALGEFMRGSADAAKRRGG